jgi:hypothetical protein
LDAKKLKPGDKVRVVEREPTTKDIRENAYFPHMAGATGTVVKVYSPEEVCVELDQESLPEANRERHEEIREGLKQRWIDSLSQEARAKLSQEEKEFHLNYSVLVKADDLEPARGGAKEKEDRLKPNDLDRVEEEFLKSRTSG